MRTLCTALLLTSALPAFGQDAQPTPAPETPDEQAEEREEDAEEEGEQDDLAAIKARIDALTETVAAQQAQLEAQASKLADQSKELGKQREGLTKLRLDRAGEKKLKLDITGYYRARGHVFGAGTQAADGTGTVPGALFADQPTSGQFLNQRLRLALKVSYKDVANLNVHVQALDNVVWGDNASLARTALFAGNPSLTGIDGQEQSSFEILRVWTEFKIPIGQIRVGRMSSQWGMGLLVNDGDGFRNDFGEAYFSNQFDRILFATNPVAIAQAITKKEEKNTPPVFFVFAYDMLVNDPLVQYYGYRCSPGVDRANARYDARCDIDGDGVTDRDHSWTDDRDASRRNSSWWADTRDDVNEAVFALFYRGQGIKYLGGVGDLFAGFYAIHRWQQETESAVTILDGTLDASVHGAFLQFEGVGIIGNTRGLTLPNSETDDPLAKTARIASYALRAGYGNQWWKVVLESGFASGDNAVNDALFTGRSINPDYNVGLLLYEEVIKEVTQRQWVGDASALRSQGGVYNSHYLFPRVKFFPMNNTELILGAVVAFPDKPDGAVIRCGQADVDAGSVCTPIADASPILGWELALALKHRFHEHILVSFETAYANATNRLPLAEVGLNPDGHFFTFQARAAWEF